MTESLLDIRDRLAAQGRSARLRSAAARASLAAHPSNGAAAVVEPALPTSDALGTCPQVILEHPETHRLMVATPAVEQAARSNSSLLHVSGRLVRAEQANANGALWKQSDLEYGLPTVAYGPLNYQHDGNKILGTLLDPRLVQGEKAADGTDVGPYIHTEGVLWRWSNHELVAEVASYLGQGKAWLSMECVSERVQCTGPTGCGQIMSYRDAVLKTERACSHVKDRSAQRRLVDPTFQGAAVIVPPQTPAWADADLVLRQETTRQMEVASTQIKGLNEAEAAGMIMAMMAYAGT